MDLPFLLVVLNILIFCECNVQTLNTRIAYVTSKAVVKAKRKMSFPLNRSLKPTCIKYAIILRNVFVT